MKCNKPGVTIAAAIAALPPGPATLTIQGTCFEDPIITRDDLTLKSFNPSARVDGTITIDGARRVVIDDLTVTGSGSGIVGTHAALFTVQNSDISDNLGSGIGVFQGASAIITNNKIERNGVDPLDFGEGIDVIGGADATITDNVITDSLFTGVFVARTASATLAGNTIDNNGLTTEDCGIDVTRSSAVRLAGGNTISNGGFAAICVERASAFRQGAFTVDGLPFPGETPDVIIQGVGAEAIFVQEDSTADFRNANITGSIDLNVLSSIRVRNGSITGDIFANNVSGVRIFGNTPDAVDFNGILNCSPNSFAYGFAGCGETCTGLVGGNLVCAP